MEIMNRDFAETCDLYVCRPAGEMPLADNKLAQCSSCGVTIMHRPDGPVKPKKVCMTCAILKTRDFDSKTVTTDEAVKDDGHQTEVEWYGI